jgi:tripartite-type tricarboxylate transporter receptor subunit TctC
VIKNILFMVLFYISTVQAGETVKIIVPSSPGGSTGILTNFWADELNARLSKKDINFVVEYKPSSGGVIAHQYVADQPAENLVLTLTSQAVIQSAIKSPNWRMNEQLIPFAYGGSCNSVLFVSGKGSILKVSDIANRRRHVFIGHAGEGSASWLDTLSASERLDLDYDLVAYKGGSAALLDLIPDRINLMGECWHNGMRQQVESGKVRPLLILGEHRVAGLTRVPTSKESGMGVWRTPVVWLFYRNRTNRQQLLDTVSHEIFLLSQDKMFKQKLKESSFVLNKINNIEEFVNEQIPYIRKLNSTMQKETK